MGKEIFNGEATQTRRGEWFKLKLGGETYLPGGAAFQWGHYWGVFTLMMCQHYQAVVKYKKCNHFKLS